MEGVVLSIWRTQLLTSYIKPKFRIQLSLSFCFNIQKRLESITKNQLQSKSPQTRLFASLAPPQPLHPIFNHFQIWFQEIENQSTSIKMPEGRQSPEPSTQSGAQKDAPSNASGVDSGIDTKGQSKKDLEACSPPSLPFFSSSTPLYFSQI